MNRENQQDRDGLDPQCPDCGGPIRTELVPDRFTYGTGSEAVELRCTVPVRICDQCGAEFIDEEGEQIRHETVCRHLGLLTPSEVQVLRQRFGTQAAFANLTGIGEASLSRWETGASIQSKAYDNYLRLLGRAENVAYLLSRLKPGFADNELPQTGRFRCIEVTRARQISQASFVLRPAA